MGAPWAFVDVFVLGNREPTFGPAASLRLGLPASVTDRVADHTESAAAIVLAGLASGVLVLGIVLGAAVLAGGASRRGDARRG